MAKLAASTIKQIAVDANLLLLMVVGNSNPRLIAGHKRLSNYTVRDFELVRDFVSSFQSIAASAHVLTEVSNLAAFGTREAKAAIYRQLARTIIKLDERPISSALASACSEFSIFGLTDAALSIVCLEMPLLTDDGPLAAHLRRKGVAVWTLEDLKAFRSRANNG